MTRLLIVGPPGAGKGTQSSALAADLGVPAISTGDMFRDHLERQTPLGLQVKMIMAAGDYVPDEITNEVVKVRLSQPDTAQGFILDGYPRTLPQIQELDRILNRVAVTLDAVIQLAVNVDELTERLLKRAIAQGRSDDTADAIHHRFSVYEATTAPLLQIYRDRGLLLTTDGLGSADEVASVLRQKLHLAGV